MTEPKGFIAVVDDDPEMRSLLEDFLRKQHYQVQGFESGVHFLEFMKSNSPEVTKLELVLSDIQMPHLTGLELVQKVKELATDLPVILVTAFGSIESAISGMKNGAFDYVTKPFKLNELLLDVERGINFFRLHHDNKILRKQILKTFERGSLIGQSKSMQQLFQLIERVSHANANILITGESGTGKEVVARMIHNMGPRVDQAFVAVNCTAIPDALLESELFGHAKGSFTGAYQRKKGLFEEADGGTIFLDEIGDMDLSLQAKLLRVIQERKIRPVGDNVVKAIDVRIVAATHKDLKAAIKEGNFREDLYYRLSVIPVVIPALRHRKEDIPLLANHFLAQYVARNGSGPRGFSPAALQALTNLRWDGNVRELENLVERLVVMNPHPVIQETDLPNPEMANVEELLGDSTRDLPTLEQLEKRYMQIVLEKTGGKKDKAAHILGINRRTLYRKEREYGFLSESEMSEEPVEISKQDSQLAETPNLKN